MAAGAAISAAAALFLLAACSTVTEPVPVATYDGRYAGGRHSNDPMACGIDAATGRSSASVIRGQVRIDLFDARTRLDGTVGEDGTLRASGFWPAPHSFAAITLLKGRIDGDTLSGTASNFRCTTEIRLARQGRSRRPGPVIRQ